MAATLPQCSRITRKRGVYYFRRRLPRSHGGEIALSLRTRHYRKAEYLGEALTRVTKREPSLTEAGFELGVIYKPSRQPAKTLWRTIW